MPVTVIVRREGDDSPSLTFDGSRIVIGRSDGSDVRLPDPSVSLRHASLRAEGSGFAIVDEGSTNGTWVGGVRLPAHTPRLVKTGDIVRVGRVWLELAVGQLPVTPDLAFATRDIALAMVKKAMEAHGDETRAKVRVAEGPDMGVELALAEENRPYILGRSERCDLPLADEDASREHASLTRRGNQIFLKDLGSSNGVQLGEQRITPDRDYAWRPPVMARIGVSVLALEEPISQVLADLGSLADEKLSPALNQEALTPPPSSLAGPPTPKQLEARAVTAPPAPSVPPKALDAGYARNEITVSRRRKRTWTFVDVAVVGVAIAIIGASIAGLIWVLR